MERLAELGELRPRSGCALALGRRRGRPMSPGGGMRRPRSHGLGGWDLCGGRRKPLDSAAVVRPKPASHGSAGAFDDAIQEAPLSKKASAAWTAKTHPTPAAADDSATARKCAARQRGHFTKGAMDWMAFSHLARRPRPSAFRFVDCKWSGLLPVALVKCEWTIAPHWASGP